MNSFVSQLLSLILSTLKSLIREVWMLAGGRGGQSAVHFIGDHWILMVIVLCAAGWIIDRLVYFFRWRPDAVWRGRKLMRKGEWQQVYVYTPKDNDPEDDMDWPQPVESYDPMPEASVQPYMQDTAPLWDEEPPMGMYDQQVYDQPAVYRDPVYPQDEPDPLEEWERPVGDTRQWGQVQQQITPEDAMDWDSAMNPEVFTDQTARDIERNFVYTPFSQRQSNPEEESRKPGVVFRMFRNARNLVGLSEEGDNAYEKLQNHIDPSEAFNEPVFPQDNSRP